MFDCQYVIYVTNFKAFYILLNIQNDTPLGILYYFIFLFDGYKDNNLSEMVFIISY